MSSKNQPLSYTKEELNGLLKKHLEVAYITIGLFVFFLIILMTLIIYCIYKLVQTYLFYRRQKKANQRLLTTSSKGVSDDYPQETESKIKYNDYELITGNMDKKVAEFKSYNERLKQFYVENRPNETPKDIIDKSIFDIKHDNY